MALDSRGKKRWKFCDTTEDRNLRLNSSRLRATGFKLKENLETAHARHRSMPVSGYKARAVRVVSK